MNKFESQKQQVHNAQQDDRLEAIKKAWDKMSEDARKRAFSIAWNHIHRN